MALGVPRRRRVSFAELAFHDWTPEFRFHPTRKWRFDYAKPDLKLALEIQGGGWTNGRHSRALGMSRDYEKLAEALLLGWIVFYATPQQVHSGQAHDWISRYLSQRDSTRHSRQSPPTVVN